jgi:hypothetical protein
MENNKHKMKFAYLHDPNDHRRVATLVYAVDDIANVIRYNYTVNKIVDNATLDSRLRLIVGKTVYKDLNKRFYKRFGGDAHCKNQARLVAIGKLKKRAFEIPYQTYQQGKIILLIVEDILQTRIKHRHLAHMFGCLHNDLSKANGLDLSLSQYYDHQDAKVYDF